MTTPRSPIPPGVPQGKRGIARAPGKLVLSGAYAVLEGAPALVAAVDRYAVADTGRPALRVTPEVSEALARRGSTKAPWFDAADLRDPVSGHKLGLGSSAAILVASLAALELERDPEASDDELTARVVPAALAAHRAAQGGGSGVDVAASGFGGILRFRRETADAAPEIEPITLPDPLFIGVFSSAIPASTPDMVARVAALRDTHPREHRRLMDRLGAAASMAARAETGSRFVDACREQVSLLAQLGDLAGVPIVTAEARALDRAVSGRGVVIPSGAGGGDIVLYVGTVPPYEDFRTAGKGLGFVPLPLTLGARGVHAAPLFERNEASS